jgi:hypothetical protein
MHSEIGLLTFCYVGNTVEIFIMSFVRKRDNVRLTAVCCLQRGEIARYDTVFQWKQLTNDVSIVPCCGPLGRRNPAACRAPRLLLRHGACFRHSAVIIVIGSCFLMVVVISVSGKVPHQWGSYIPSAFFFADFTHHIGFDSVSFQIPIQFSKQLTLQILDRYKIASFLCFFIM